MSATVTDTNTERDTERLLGELRPRLHRYCARMTGSVVDGEDVVQEALIKAIEALPGAQPITHPESWLFRIAHNAALDFLRRRTRSDALFSGDDPDTIVDPIAVADERQAAAASLRTFLRLPAAQRSCVILMDVLGYSLAEVGAVMDATIPAVKAALHRGRTRLRELGREPEDMPPPLLNDRERLLLARYVDRFNARDFDAIRDMIAEEVQLDLVDRVRMRGRREVANYFGRYASVETWRLVAGTVDGHPAAIVHDARVPSGHPTYFILLGLGSDEIATIRDFRYAPYAMEGAEIAEHAPDGR
jgi:RNA polymerase sigma-70 factor (ECF subfamily)